MFTKEASKLLPTNLGLGSETKLEISAVHFLNKVVLQLRLNGELDTCYEVDTKGIPAEGLGNTPLGSTLLETGQETYSADMDEEELDGFSTIEDGLSNFSIRTRLGNSNNMKLPIICTQIAQLYQKVIFPSNVDGLRDLAPSRNFVIGLSAKIWSKDSSDTDFATLLFVLQMIKEMYN